MIRKISVAVGFIFIVTSLSAAQLLKGKLSTPQKPTITYQRVEVKTITFDKVSVDFVFLVDNPNSFGIDNVLVDYELFLKDQKAGTGKDMKVSIAASGKSDLKIPMDIQYKDGFKSAEELTKAILSGQKTIPFRLETLFKIQIGILRVQIPVTATGELPLPDAKQIPVGKSVPKIKIH